MSIQWSNLEVWKRTHQLVLDVCRVTANFPKSETYGLVNQLRRAAYSVPANIVEGQSRNSTKEYLKFLYNARGSLKEVRYFLLLCNDLGFLEKNNYGYLEDEYQTASKMLNGLIKSLR